ncbi:MAG TPA: hypothetical protein PLJ27_06290 [Polyangiaceae bacterium]|jgi:hypothetical protein|nr:hypothetical protein [Polyangiaceae bacterium]HNZ22087.1 hypothetical protein [Polyangiaceae bacterium]HOD25442.1 hypothetical protein [Polyangiaceae bacterium]HOE47395.1 hypothetical protein [Polyangiaceae bacterium]HOH02504.1 hypothetical protein [Polyangiaceae bacterium]
MMRNTSSFRLFMQPARLVSVALLTTVFGAGVGACSSTDEGASGDDWEDYGIEGAFGEDGPPLGKADSANVQGPWVNTNTTATQVWTARKAWEDKDPAAGLAWPANSGLNWDQKYSAWVDSMERTRSDSYFDTFMLTTPWGKQLPAPKLECAELAMFLRITFASWYELPFFLTATDGSQRIYFGHFGARTTSEKYKNTPNYAQVYKDYSNLSAAQYQSNWPKDTSLRAKGLYGGGDEMDFVFSGAKAGAYFDEIFLNKRVGHFMLLTLSYFGSMHLASTRNTYNLKPESVKPGDVLLERWQRKGIGHTLVVKEVTSLEMGQLEVNLASGSMPRRQPKWEDAVASKSYFTNNYCGGTGTNSDGDSYASLGGGLKRWRVVKNINGYWTNTWMKSDEASWISDTDTTAISSRPEQFETLLGESDPAAMRDSLLAMIEDNRNHLRNYPASCAARTRREEGFDKLYTLMQNKFGWSKSQVDQKYRILEDYVFAELEYDKSKTCCWNSTTSVMHQIAVEYNESLMTNQCVEPVVFKWNNGYDVFKQYAEQTGRGFQWKPWSADETCPQQNVQVDTEANHSWVPYCSLD